MRLLIILFVATLLPFFCPAQNADVEEIALRVKEILDARDEMTRYKKLETAAAFYYIYYAEGEVKLIASMQMDEGLEKKVNWFFGNGQLLYTETIWERESGSIAHAEKTYHQAGKLIYWEKETDQPEKDPAELQAMEKNLNNYAHRLLKEAEKLSPQKE